MGDPAIREAGPEPDTIVARATPPGRGALALLRLSGPGARKILDGLTGGGDPPGARRVALRTLVDPRDGRILDRALVTYFPAPGSYTGEDVVEISTHGGTLVPALVEEACRNLGARPAEPGEFTRRAWLNGRLDLLQVEAVQDLIEGESRAAHRTAVHQMEGGLSARVGRIRQGLVRLEALLAHHVDFPEEDDPPTPLARVEEEGEALLEEIRGLLRLAPEGTLLREGALVVLAGPPNAGKSSLFNLLVGEERAIVTEEPGTTRDALEAVVSIEGYPFRLVDTAGLRERAGRVERLGVEVAHRYLERAQAVLYCHPVDRPWGAAEETFLAGLGDRPVLLLTSLADRAPGAEGPVGRHRRPSIPVSARTGEGVQDLREALRNLVFAGLLEAGENAAVVTRERQRRRLLGAAEELEAFGAALRGGVPADVAATHLRGAAVELEELVGVVDPEEVLDHLFASFCVGK
jgi:tRNA modification GTPase